MHVGLDGIDVFLLFFGRIGVVEAQMALAGKLLRDAEIKGNRLGVADMQVAVRLRRKSVTIRCAFWSRGRPARCRG